MTAFAPRKNVIIGMSHMVALKDAFPSCGHPDINLIQIIGDKYHNALGSEIWSTAEFKNNGRDTLSPARLFGSPFGNFHNVLGLVESPEPFDFIIDGDDELDDERLFVPHQMMLEYFENGNSQIAAFYVLWRSVFPHTEFFHLMSPPPLEGGAKLYNRPKIFPGLEEYGPTKRAVRLKLYSLQCRVIEAVCAKHGVSVIKPPAEAVCADGFLKADFATDPTHGNGRYGDLVLRQILA